MAPNKDKLVTVYFDPISCENPEGKAQVIQVLNSNVTHAYCCVRFVGERRITQTDRWVDLEQLKEAGVEVAG